MLVGKENLCRDYFSKGLYFRYDKKVIGLDWNEIESVKYFGLRTLVRKFPLSSFFSSLFGFSLYLFPILFALLSVKSLLFLPFFLASLLPLFIHGTLEIRTVDGKKTVIFLKDRETVVEILKAIPEEKKFSLLKEIKKEGKRFFSNF